MSIPGWGRKPGERDRLPAPVFLGFPSGSAGEESTCNPGDLGLIPGLGRSPGGELPTPVFWRILDYIVHGITKSQT